MWKSIAQHIQSVTGRPFQGSDRVSIGGGCINQAFRVWDAQQSYFVKLNKAKQVSLFEAEALALQELSATQSIRVPRSICWGVAATQSYLVLEWINLDGAPDWSAMGRQLAQLHRTSSQEFGWHRENVIGETPQPNPWTQDWAEFFAEHRIKYQLELAHRNGGRFSHAESLLNQIPQLLKNHSPEPSLVHGDLWSGNAAFAQTGPVVFDPAAYYGDREVDLAMTGLFGGFPEAFYQGYQAAWPLNPGYQQRKALYNLYHVLNHFNLFGGGYASQADQMMKQLVTAR
jgi:fructosamine-3-kinase